MQCFLSCKGRCLQNQCNCSSFWKYPLVTYLNKDSFTMCLSLLAPGLSTHFHIPPSPHPASPPNIQRYLKIDESPETPENPFFSSCLLRTVLQKQEGFVEISVVMIVALSITLFRICNHAIKYNTHLSRDVNEILVHVYIHVYIH